MQNTLFNLKEYFETKENWLKCFFCISVLKYAYKRKSVQNIRSHLFYLLYRIIDCNLSHFQSRGCFGIIAAQNLKPVKNSISRDYFNKEQAHRQELTYDYTEAILMDARRLTCTKSIYSLPTTEGCIIARVTWTKRTPILAAKTDGIKFAVATGISTHSVCSDIPELTAAFMSVSDLSNGLKSMEVCRWPLQLGSCNEDTQLLNPYLPRYIPSYQSWNLTSAKPTLLKPYICVGNSSCQIEVIT